MTEEVSNTVIMAVILIMAAGLISVVIVVGFPFLQQLSNQTDKNEIITSADYRQMQGMSGEIQNAPRIYRNVMAISGNVASVIIRRKPVTEPNNYEIVMCNVTDTKITGAQSAVSTHTLVSEDEQIKQLYKIFNRELANHDFRLTVYTTSDTRLEILCDMMDEYRED